MTRSRVTTYENRVVRCSIAFYNLAKGFKHNLWSSLSRGHKNINNNGSLLLLFDGLWKVMTDYMVQDKHSIFYLSE